MRNNENITNTSLSSVPQKNNKKCSYLLEEVKVNAVSLLLSNKEVTLFETGRDGSDIDAVGIGHDNHVFGVVVHNTRWFVVWLRLHNLICKLDCDSASRGCQGSQSFYPVPKGHCESNGSFKPLPNERKERRVFSEERKNFFSLMLKNTSLLNNESTVTDRRYSRTAGMLPKKTLNPTVPNFQPGWHPPLFQAS